jgi:predicted DNA-binding transcriptional regulator AlpA
MVGGRVITKTPDYQSPKQQTQKKENVFMKKLSNFDDYPPVLQAADVKEILGLSTGATYALLKSEGFPTVSIGGKRKVIVKDEFVAWLTDSTRKIKRVPILTMGK